MSDMYIDYNKIETSAGVIDDKNGDLLTQLHEIQSIIKNLNLQGIWESDSAVEIRGKIEGMEQKFIEYHDIVDNYVKTLNNVITTYKATEKTLTTNAGQFV